MTLEDIRHREQQSHIKIYSEHNIYEEGSWLRKPVKTVVEQLSFLENHPKLTVLDLGCGIGRNAIAIADRFRNTPCHIDCVDILPIAIEKLYHNAEKFQVSQSIHGVISSIDHFSISENQYDLIIAVSSLEHMDSKESFIRKLAEIQAGIKNDGILCIIMNTEIFEIDKRSKMQVPAQFEINFPQEELQTVLQHIFSGWHILKNSVQYQQYDIPRDDHINELHTHVVTFVAKK